MEKNKREENTQARLENIAIYLDQTGSINDAEFLRELGILLRNVSYSSGVIADSLEPFRGICIRKWEKWDGQESRCKLCGLWRFEKNE